MLSLNNAKYITIEYDYGSYIGGIPKICGSNIDLVYMGVSMDIICFEHMGWLKTSTFIILRN